jgi:hypothetical protein
MAISLSTSSWPSIRWDSKILWARFFGILYPLSGLLVKWREPPIPSFHFS